jgi:hypothetical protein
VTSKVLDPTEMVRSYLIASGERRMEEATRFLASNAILVFPQGRFENLSEMVSAMAGRYRSIGKTHDTWDTAQTPNGETVIVTTGTLHGVNNYGKSFEDIRFCDRFVVREGLIAEQHVWNDLAESGVLESDEGLPTGL